MIELKLRAWDVRSEKMYEVVALDWDDKGNIISAHLKDKKGVVEKFYPEEDYGDKVRFMQYSGRKDKRKTCIYDGDVLKDENGDILIVKFGDYINYDIAPDICEYTEYGWYMEGTDGKCFGMTLEEETLEIVTHIYNLESYYRVMERYYKAQGKTYKRPSPYGEHGHPVNPPTCGPALVMEQVQVQDISTGELINPPKCGAGLIPNMEDLKIRRDLDEA